MASDTGAEVFVGSTAIGVGADAGVVAVVRASFGDKLGPPSRSLLSLSRSRSRSRATASTYPPTSVATCLKSRDLDSVRERREWRDSDVGDVTKEGLCGGFVIEGIPD